PWRTLISEDRNIDLHLSPSSRPDISRQGWKADMWIGNLVWDELRTQGGSGWRIVWTDIIIFRSQAGEGRHSDGILVVRHMAFGNLSSVASGEQFPLGNRSWFTYLHRIFDSTFNKSRKPTPHGLPGVASSMKRPNS